MLQCIQCCRQLLGCAGTCANSREEFRTSLGLWLLWCSGGPMVVPVPPCAVTYLATISVHPPARQFTDRRLLIFSIDWSILPEESDQEDLYAGADVTKGGRERRSKKCLLRNTWWSGPGMSNIHPANSQTQFQNIWQVIIKVIINHHQHHCYEHLGAVAGV